MALTKREKEVIELLCLGYGNKEISCEMKISPRTVETYIERLMLKLRVRNRLALVVAYVKEYK